MKKAARKVFSFPFSSHAAILLSSELLIGFCSVIGSLFIFGKLADKVIDKEVIFFDSIITNFIYQLRSPQMTEIMKGITFFGGEVFLGGAIVLTILVLFAKSYKKDAFIFSFILFFGIGLNLLLKNLFDRPRPHFLPLVHESSYSFPSGHSMNSFIFYMAVSYFIFRNTRNKKLGLWLSCIAGLLVLAIGFSRVYLGVHYPSDVLAGFAAGLLWFTIVLLFEKTILFLRLFKKQDSQRLY